VQHRDAQLGQAVVLEVEAFGHAAVDAVALLHAVLERQAGEVAVELVGPLVVRADEAARVALRLLAEAHAAMRAAVLHHADAGSVARSLGAMRSRTRITCRSPTWLSL
jgi:hypothetical protein